MNSCETSPKSKRHKLCRVVLLKKQKNYFINSKKLPYSWKARNFVTNYPRFMQVHKSYCLLGEYSRGGTVLVEKIKLSTLPPGLHERIFISSCNQTSLLVFRKIAFRVQNNWLPSCVKHHNQGLRNFCKVLKFEGLRPTNLLYSGLI